MMPTPNTPDDWGDKTRVMTAEELQDAVSDVPEEDETVVMSRSHIEELGLVTESDTASTIPDGLEAPVDETHLKGIDEKTIRMALSPDGLPEIKA